MVKWTDSACKALPSWEGEGQQFHSKLYRQYTWAEEGMTQEGYHSWLLEKMLGGVGS